MISSRQSNGNSFNKVMMALKGQTDETKYQQHAQIGLCYKHNYDLAKTSVNKSMKEINETSQTYI